MYIYGCICMYIHVYTYDPTTIPQTDGVGLVTMRSFCGFNVGPLRCLRSGLPRKPRPASQPASKPSQPRQPKQSTPSLLYVSSICRPQQIDQRPFSSHSSFCFNDVYVSTARSTCCLENRAPASARPPRAFYSVRTP